MAGGDGSSPRSRVLRVTAGEGGAHEVYWNPWISVRLETGEVEIYDRPRGGEPLASYPVRQVSIDWRAVPGVP